jgi:hypothetical protein
MTPFSGMDPKRMPAPCAAQLDHALLAGRPDTMPTLLAARLASVMGGVDDQDRECNALIAATREDGKSLFGFLGGLALGLPAGAGGIALAHRLRSVAAQTAVSSGSLVAGTTVGWVGGRRYGAALGEQIARDSMECKR